MLSVKNIGVCIYPSRRISRVQVVRFAKLRLNSARREL